MMSQTFRLTVASVLLFAVCLLPDRLHAQGSFRRGDVDDSGSINLTDAVHLVSVLFDITRDFPCYDAADADDSGRVQLTDAVYLLSFLFQQGAPPPSPFPACGVDPTPDGLVCGRRGRCWRGLDDSVVDPLFEPLGGRETFVFVVDRSGSMAQGELVFAKSVITQRIQNFSEDYEFAVIFFDRTFLQYPEDGIPVRATREQKDAVTSWIGRVFGGSGTCPEEALSVALTMSRQSAAAGKRIIYLGDGGATCNGAHEGTAQANTLETIAAENTEGVIIHAVSIESFGVMHRNFLQALVDASGGLLVEIDL